MPLPAVTLQWHPTKGWKEDVADVDWVTIARGWRSMVFDRGVNEHSERTEASTITVVLDDHDRSLDPTNRLGPNWGNLIPRRHLRVIVVIGGVTYSLWRGFTTGFWPEWSLNDAQVTIGGVDLLGMLANVEMPRSILRLYLAAMAPKWALDLDEAGGPYAYSTGTDRLPWVHTSVKLNAGGIIPYDGLGSVSYGETGVSRTSYLGFDRIAPPFTVIFWMEVAPGPSATIVPYAQGQGGGSAGFADGDLGFYIGTDGLGVMGVNDGARSAYVKAGSLDLGRPVLVAGRYDLLAGVPTLKLTINTTHYTATHAAPLIYPRSGPAYIGNSVPLSHPFRGKIAGFRRWDRYLSDTDLVGIYLSGTYPADGQRSDERIAGVLDFAGVPAALRNLDVGESLLGAWKVDRFALENIGRAVATERGRVFVDRQGRLTFHSRHHAGTVRATYSTKPEVSAGAGLMELGLSTDDRSVRTVARGTIPLPTDFEWEYRHPNAELLGEIPWNEPTAFRTFADLEAGIRDVVGSATPEFRLSPATSRYGGPGVDPADLLLTDIGDTTVLYGHPVDESTAETYGPFVTWGTGVLGSGADAGDGWGATAADDGWAGPPPLRQNSTVLGITHTLDGRALTYDVARTTAPYKE